MCVSGWPITLLLFHILESGSFEQEGCPLMISPSRLVVRFGDPASVNCSLPTMDFSGLGWEVPLATPNMTMDRFLVWRVDSLTEWSMKPVCFALADHGGQCVIVLDLTVYKPPDSVSISYKNHSGSMLEGRLYTLQCLVQDVAPVENLTVTFYKDETALGPPQSGNDTKEGPATELFTVNITPSKEDDGARYWCEAKLDLGPEGPQLPPVLKSQTLIAVVNFGPQFLCPTKLQIREGEALSCEVRGNPNPLVTWLRDGQVVAPPTYTSRRHAGNYTVSAKGPFGQFFHMLEVEVLTGKGTSYTHGRYFLMAVLSQMICWL
ncbi:intercellular adhesion molecule 2-like [Polymixia lowei]